MISLNEVKERYEIDENEWLNYLEFIKEHALPKDYEGYCERHHIYPRALFPELVKNKDNIVRLLAKDHLRSHHLLYKAFKHQRSVIFSFNMMLNRGKYNPNFQLSSVEEYFEKYAEDYEQFRLAVAKIISETNSGRKHSEESKERTSKLFKNKVVVKDKDGKIFQTTVDDPKYVSGEYVYYRVGYKHKEETKQKMSENGIKGLHSFYDKDGNTVYAEECPDGYTYGLPEKHRESLSKSIKNLTYIYNPTTGETRRQYNYEELPEGFIKHRQKKGNFVGFDKINENVRCYDIRDNTVKMIKKGTQDLEYQIISPVKQFKTSIQDNIVILQDNMYFFNIDIFNEYMEENYNIHIPDKIGTSISRVFLEYPTAVINIRSTHGDINKCLKMYNGKLWSDILPLTFIRYKDIMTKDEIKLYVSDKMREKYGQ
jgi:hypothetical protein